MKFTEKLKNFFSHGKRSVKIDLQFPTSWEAMTAEDFRNVCIILNTPRSKQETLFLCFCKLAGVIPDDPKKYNPKEIKDSLPVIVDGKSYILSAKTVAAACKELEFITDGAGLPPSPFTTVDRMLYGISFDTYFRVDSFMAAAAAQNNEGMVKLAIRTITGGRVRKALPWQRRAMVIWWNGVKDMLLKKYPYCFERGEGISDKTQADILQDILLSMNGNHPQENEKILKCECHSVFVSLDKIYRDAKQRYNYQGC